MTAYTPASAIASFPTYDMLKPTEGPRIARAAVNIDTDGKGRISLNAPNLQFSSVQGVWVDNDTAATVTVTHVVTGFRIIALPRTQGWYQMEATDDLTFDITSSVPSSVVMMQFSNTETHTAVTQTLNSAAALDAQGRQRVVVESQNPPQAGNAVTLVARNTTASTNAVYAANGTRTLSFLSAWNNSNAAQYLKFYNKNSAPNPATDVPILVVMIPPGGSLNFEFGPTSAVFIAGIGIAVTAGPALQDNTALPAADTSGYTIGYR